MVKVANEVSIWFRIKSAVRQGCVLSPLYGFFLRVYMEVLRVQGARMGLKINLKEAKSLRLGMSEDEKVMLVSEKLIRLITSLILVVLLVNMVGAVKM